MAAPAAVAAAAAKKWAQAKAKRLLRKYGPTVIFGFFFSILMAPIFFAILLADAPDPAEASSCSSPGGASTKVKIESLTKDQVNNAASIVAAGQQKKMSSRGILVGLMTAMQESTLMIYANDGKRGPEDSAGTPSTDAQLAEAGKTMSLPHQAVGTDHASAGLFQQQVGPGFSWGTYKQVMDPVYSAGKFFDTLKGIGGWESMDLGQAAQSVQSSAFPSAYTKWESLGRQLISKLDGNIQIEGSSCGDNGGAGVGPDGWVSPVPKGSSMSSPFGPRGGRLHAGVDIPLPVGTPLKAAASGKVVPTSSMPGGYGTYVIIDHGDGVETLYGHMSGKKVEGGDQVKAGDIIGPSGNSGSSTGPHVHYEIRIKGKPVDPIPFMSSKKVKLVG